MTKVKSNLSLLLFGLGLITVVFFVSCVLGNIPIWRIF